MASNELAAILARRRAKEGGESNEAPAVSSEQPPSPVQTGNPAVSNGANAPAANAPKRSSIAERIAKLQQGGAPGPDFSAGVPRAIPIPIAVNRGASQMELGSAGASDQQCDAAASHRRTSEKIQQLQGNLGINVNPFGAPGGYRRPGGGGGSSIMTTGDQYAHTHGGMGIAMPGMGAAIPMPGLAKAGTRIPGMASESPESAEPESAPDVSHATMSRAAGPKRRGPTRGPPPGAFRMPGIGTDTTTEPVAVALAPPAVVEESKKDDHGLFGNSATSTSAPQTTPAPPAPANVAPVPVQQASSLFGASEPSASSESVSIASLRLDDDATPKPNPSQPSAALFGAPASAVPTPAAVIPSRSAPNDDFSSDSEDEAPSKPSSLFGAPVQRGSIGPATQSSAPAMSSLRDPPAPETAAPAPVPVPAPVPASASAPDPAPASASAPTPVAPSGLATIPRPTPLKVDESSDSDWSEDEDDRSGKPSSLFGAPAARSSVSASSVSAPAPAPRTTSSDANSLFGSAAPSTATGASTSSSLFGHPAPVLTAAPVNEASSLFGAPATTSQSNGSNIVTATAPTTTSSGPGSLFGSAAPVATIAPAAASAAIPQGGPAIPTPQKKYSSLFLSDGSSDESDDEGGLFGTGLPKSR